MYILGISAYYHDSAAALIKDGEIISAAQEERFTRIKHDSAFPINAIRFILEDENIDISEIKFFAFYDKPLLKFERLIETYIATAPKGFSSFRMAMPIWLREKLFLKDLILKELKTFGKKIDSKQVLFGEHHMSHAASAFYPSPFEKSLILTLDGVGEWATTTLCIGNNNEIDILKEINFPHSLGLLYSAFTFYTGFKVNSGEYKLMGLAPYGKPIYRDLILQNLIDLKDDGSFMINQNYFSYTYGLKMTNKKFDDLFGQPARNPESEDLTQFHMDIASSIQNVLEECVLKLTRSLSEEYKIENLCLAGGVALNCVANGKILNDSRFKNIWVQPAAGDAGGALGAAMLVWHKELNNKRHVKESDAMKGSYLGPSYSNQNIEKSLVNNKAIFEKMNSSELIDRVSHELANGKIVGWFQGKMEFGPRALGARSILGNPLIADMQKKLNLKVKFRESFRPFAPSILRESVNDWFEFNSDSPYMLFTTQVKKEKCLDAASNKEKKLFGIDLLNLKRSEIPAVTHVDYSARIQTVHEKTNYKYHKLIKKFDDLTNCPILINTSFNVRGEPIVCTPDDAFRCFMGTDIDILVIEDYYLEKENQNLNQIEKYENKYELD